jgi:hypothetical protein
VPRRRASRTGSAPALWGAADAILIARYDAHGLEIGNEAGARLLGLRQRRPAGASYLLGGKRREIGHDLVRAQAGEQPVEHGREAGVVEPGADHAGHAHQVVTTLRVSGEVSDEAGQPGHVAWSALAADAVAAAAPKRPVELRPLIAAWRCGLARVGRRGGRRREQDNGERDAPDQASPIRMALEQW